MMPGFNSSISSSIVWCMIHVSLISTVGIIGSWLVSKRQAHVASSIVTAAVVTSGTLTLLAPFAVHQCFVFESRRQELSHPRVGSATSPSDQRGDAGSKHALPSDLRLNQVDLLSLGLAIQSVITTMEKFDSLPGPRFLWFQSLFILVISIGLLRFVAGALLVLRIRRQSQPVTDVRLTSMLQQLMLQLDCQTRVTIRENSAITDAAVAGWRHPVLILSGEWRRWSDDELRSVIAHELAHVVRNDSVWRVISAGLAAIHFFNPFVHGLFRRATFYQELAADSLAASVVGPKVYLCSLSRIAIRHDDLSRRIVTPDIQPVFSGHLIRRIKMLNSMDGHSRIPTPQKSTRQPIAITAVFCMLGLASLATRGIAEPPEDAARPKAAPFKTVSFVKPNADSLPKPTSDPTNGMFRHSPLDPGLAPNHPDGLVVIRVRELLERPEMRNYATALNGLVAQGLSHVLKSENVPEMSFESIEWITATPSFSLIEQKNDPSERSHRLMMGTGGAVIRFHQPIDLAGWFERFSPNSKKHEFEGRILYELELPFLGPQPCYFWQSDERTLRSRVLTREFPQADRPSLDVVKQWIKSSEQPVTVHTAAWVPTWNRTDKGLVSIVLCKADLSGINEKFYEKSGMEGSLGIAAGNFIRQLLSQCRSTAFLLDMADGPTMGIRFSLLHHSGDSARTSLKLLEDLAEAVKVDLENQFQKLDSSKEKDNDRMKYHVLKQAFGMGYASIQEHSDGTASLDVSTAFPFFMIVEAMHSLD